MQPLIWDEFALCICTGKRGGKPCIRGLRITVEDVLDYFGAGMTEQEILGDFDYLTHEDILACFAFAADRIGIHAQSADEVLFDENLIAVTFKR